MGAGKKAFLGLGIVVLAFVILIGGGLTYVFLNLDSLAKKTMEKTLSVVLQVDVSIGSVQIKIKEGSVEIDDLSIGNPEGFKTNEAMQFDRIYTKVDIESLKSDQIVVNDIEVTGGKVTLEQGKGGSNLSAIQKNASRFSSGESAEGEKNEGASKSVVIDKVVLDDLKVGVSATALQGKDVSFPLPRIEMNDVGKDDNTSVAEAVQQVISEIIKKTVSAGAGVIPTDLTDTLKGSLEGLGNTQKSITDSLKNTGESIGNLFKKKEESE